MELKLNRKKTVKIIDNFLFRNEYDLLEIRLRTHYKHVDQFVIVESDHTFTGIYKGFNLPKQLERYAPWKDKIRYIHSKDVSDPKHWEDDNLYRYISRKMLEHQINNNPATQHHVNLGRQDRTVTDLTDSNTDMFSSLMPVKI